MGVCFTFNEVQLKEGVNEGDYSLLFLSFPLKNLALFL